MSYIDDVGSPSRVLVALHQEAGTLSRRFRRSDASLPLLELGLASPASPTTIGLTPPQFENRVNMCRICHILAGLLVCAGLLRTVSGFIFDYLHPEYVSSFPSYLYFLRAVPFLVAAGAIETPYRSPTLSSFPSNASLEDLEKASDNEDLRIISSPSRGANYKTCAAEAVALLRIYSTTGSGSSSSFPGSK